MTDYLRRDGVREEVESIEQAGHNLFLVRTKAPQVEPFAQKVNWHPLVSILLPTFNYAHRIEAALQSIQDQSYDNYELIVCDDGSSDDTIARLQPWVGKGLVSAVLVHGPNRGAAAAINTAAKQISSQAELVTWVSADNVMTKDWLTTLVKRLSFDGVGVAYANYDRFTDTGEIPGTWGKPYDPERLINDQNCYVGPAFLVKADVWKATGELRGKNSCDYDHWLRIEETCQAKGLKFDYVSDVLCHYYAGNERATVTRCQDYDAGVWQEEARKRRELPDAIRQKRVGALG